jgi:predicted adenylyl cyclase CyaB
MPANIEIKAAAPDFPALRVRSEKLSGSAGQTIHQDDTFFHTPAGRLKLRTLSASLGELIYYDRPDSAGPKTCHYRISRTDDPDGLRAVLSEALGILGRVRKTRILFLVGQTRVHLDEVEGLGDFLELEVVLREGQSEAEGVAIARDLMERLGVAPENLVEGAYLDLLLRTPRCAGRER